MRAFMLVLLVGCTATVDGVSGTGSDAPPPPPAAPKPLACEAQGAFPELPPFCLGGWCWDAPKPIGNVSALLALNSELWLSLPTHVVRIANGEVQWFEQPAAVPLDHLAGSQPGDVWGHVGKRTFHLVGGAWSEIHWSTGFDDIEVAADGGVWARDEGGVLRFDGHLWQRDALPTSLGRWPSIWAMHAISASEIWFTVNMELAHLVNGQVSLVPLHTDAESLWTFAPDDVWFADATKIGHWNGSSIETYHVPHIAQLAGRAPDDLWALGTAENQTIWHWNGVAWSSCDKPLADRLAVGTRPDELWALRDGDLVHYDGAWSETQHVETVTSFEIVSPTEQLATMEPGAFLQRSPTGAWSVNTFVSAVRGSASHGTDDVWLFGDDTYHRVGGFWNLSRSGRVVNMCATPGREAFAMTPQGGVEHFDGTGWQHDGDIDPAATLFCPDNGDVWAGGAQLANLMRRDGTRWKTLANRDQLFNAYGPPGGPMWSLADVELDRFDGTDWIVDDASSLAAQLPVAPVFMDIAGAAGARWFVVGAAYDRYVARAIGSTFDRVTMIPGAARIFALGSDDAMIVGDDFTTYRLRNGVLTTLSAGPSTESPWASVWFASSRVGWATSLNQHLLRWDGRTWTVDTTLAARSGRHLLAFTASDVWTIADDISLAHWDGRRWQTVTIPDLLNGERLTDLCGASSTDLWAVTSAGHFIHVVAGVPAQVPIVGAVELWSARGTAADDVWFGGRASAPSGSVDALFHWDGQAISQYRTPKNVTAMRSVSGTLYAQTADKAVWQRAPQGWIEPVVPAWTFPAPPPLPPGALHAYGDPSQWWATAGNVIWRRP